MGLADGRVSECLVWFGVTPAPAQSQAVFSCSVDTRSNTLVRKRIQLEKSDSNLVRVL